MRTYEECIPCIGRQIERLAERLTTGPAAKQEFLEACRRFVADTDMDRPPPYFGKEIHRAVREISGNPDPYREEKERYTKRALALYPQLRERVRGAADPFRAATLIALAGNIIDFGAGDSFDLMATIEAVLESDPAIDHVDALRGEVQRANTVLYLGDNAGEAVMDRIWIEQFPPGRDVTFAVRGGPVLNDATEAEARESGLDRVATILPNGSDAPGTILSDCSARFREAFETADLVIAKGMGNYETLCDGAGREVFFVLLVKCELVARHTGSPVGKAVVLRG